MPLTGRLSISAKKETDKDDRNRQRDKEDRLLEGLVELRVARQQALEILQPDIADIGAHDLPFVQWKRL